MGIVASALFGRQAEEVEVLCPIFQRLGRSPTIRFFMGKIEGAPAVSSTLFLTGGVAGLYHVATLPEYRKRGFGTYAAVAPLLHARKMGYEIAVLQASKAGENVYTKIGFLEHCRLGRYIFDQDH
jgi:GNAT superfamily N-acetyltransferase